MEEEKVSELVPFFQTRRDEMLAVLRELVEVESPSTDKAAVDRAGERVIDLMQAAGAKVERLPCEGVGDVILGRWPGDRSAEPASKPDGKQILLLAHRDTVWPVGTLAERPPRVEGGRFYGAGGFDMKAGIVIALTALRGLDQLGRRPVGPVVLLCNGDEEIGSPGSRAVIEQSARQSGLVLCLEPPVRSGALKTARKGVAGYTLRIKGRSAHAGADHAQGVNAIEEAAHQVLALQALTDCERGTTVNVGIIRGGTRTNVVPEECEIRVDVRVATQEEAARMTEVITGLKPHLPGTEMTVEGGLGHPPMVRDALMVRTFNQVGRIARKNGLDVAEGSTGGGSDGSFAAALGVPTVDGLGAEGDGAHAVHEHVDVASLPRKAALLAALLSEWDFDA
jgi:glutamate carboxypeptidase